MSILRRAALLFVILPGCASFSTHLSPVPTAPGTTDVSAAVDAHVMRSPIVAPALDISVRRGITEGVDLGARVSVLHLGGEVNARLALLSSDTVNVSIVPGIGAGADELLDEQKLWSLRASLPILVGVNTGEHMLIAGVKMMAHLPMAGDRSAVKLFPGGLLGYQLKVSETFHVLPEVSIHVPTELSSSGRGGAPVFQGGIAFIVSS